MPSYDKNKIQTPPAKDREITQLRDGLGIVNNSRRPTHTVPIDPPRRAKTTAPPQNTAETKTPPTQTSTPQKPRQTSTAPRRTEQKTHPKYASTKSTDSDRQRLREEYRQKQLLLEKQQRIKRAREKEKQQREKERRQAAAEQKLLKKQREKERRLAAKQRAEREKKYARELSVEQNKRRHLAGAQREEYIKQTAKAIFFRSVVSLILGILLFAVSFSAFLVIFNIASDPSDTLTVTLDGTSVKYPRDEYVMSDTVYVCFDDISSMCGFIKANSSDTVTYVSPDAGNESVSLTPDSATVLINGTPTRLNAVVITKDDGKLYVPLTLFTDYVQGLSVSYDSMKCNVTVSRIVTNENAVGQGASPVYEDITFTVKSSKPLDRIDESILDE